MKYSFQTLLFLVTCFPVCRSQSLQSGQHVFDEKQFVSHENVTQQTQKYLALDLTRLIGKVRRHRFFPGDKIKFRLKDNDIRFNETILSITDSSLIIRTDSEISQLQVNEILIKDIRQIRLSRRVPFVSEASYYFPIAGALYLGADFFNKGVDNQRFTIDASSPIVSGAFIVTGLIFYRIAYAPIKINKRHVLKVLEGLK